MEAEHVPKLGDLCTVDGLVKRPDLNGMVAFVIEKKSDDRGRIGVNILGNEFKMKTENLSHEKPTLVAFMPNRNRLDLANTICKLESNEVAVVIHSGERIKIGEGLETYALNWSDTHAVMYNLQSTYGATVLPPDAGYLGGIKRDLRDMSVVPADELEQIMRAAKVEDSCGIMGGGVDEKPKPWLEALSDLLTGYRQSVDSEEIDPQYSMICDMMRQQSGQQFDATCVERVAQYFADGCIPKYYLGLIHVMMIQPPVNDLNKCELRPSSIGGAGGLGVFLRTGCCAKPGELLTLYPVRMLGKNYSKDLEGDVSLDHYITMQAQDSPEWKHLHSTDPVRLMKQAKLYSVQTSLAPGCALFASHYPTKMKEFDSAWIGHMVNSTRNGHPAANGALVPNLVGGRWGVAAIANIAAGEEVVVNYGSGWFDAHPDLD